MLYKIKYDGLIIRAVNSVKSGRVLHKNDKSQEVNKINVLKLSHSISLFFSRDFIKNVGKFDINLGLGSKTIFQGQEDRDYPIRGLKKGYKIYFERDIIVYHPWDDEKIDKSKNLIDRAYKGAAAEMYLFNKHNYSNIFKLKSIVKRIGAIFYFLLVKKNIYKAKASFSSLKATLKYY